jgi:hypothetical protein
MCQGAIVSLVKFKVGNRTKSITLKGIGSHADLVKDNIAKLTKAGWNENLPGQKVFSIESDFKAWNKFTVESGDPSKAELKILAKAYKEIAGSASALIRHVLKCGKIDDALVSLLTAPAYKIWQESKAPAYKIYQESKAQAYKIYQESKAQAYKIYQESTAPAYKIWQESKAPAYKIYQESKAQAYKIWQESTAPADKIWQESTAPADKIWQESRVNIWVSLFRKPSNRINALR